MSNPATIQQRLDWLQANQPHNAVAIKALREQLPVKHKPRASRNLVLADSPKVGREIACVWEVNLSAIQPELQRQFGQLHSVRSLPDPRGCCRITLHPFVPSRPLKLSPASDFRRRDSFPNQCDPHMLVDSHSPMKNHISGNTAKAPEFQRTDGPCPS